MPLTKKQMEYLQNCNKRWNIKIGATGSGKTFLDTSLVIPKRVLAARGEGLIVLMGNTRGSLERNILEPMRDMWPNCIGNIRSDNTVELFGKKAYALGADTKKRVASIQGPNFEYVYGDEVPTWNEEVFHMLKSRLRCPHSHFDGTGNPAGPTHWFKKFLDSDANIYLQSYTIDDGALQPHIVEELKKEYTGTVYYDRYIKGLWAAAEGSCYPTFAADPKRFIIAVPPPIVSANIGVDFGGGTSAHAFNCVGFTFRMTDMVILEELYKKEASTPLQIEQDFVEFVRLCIAKYGRIANVYCDSAEQTLINGLRMAAAKARLPVNIQNARKGPINERIRAACRLQAADRFKIMRHCVHTIDAYKSAIYKTSETNDERLDNGQTNIDSLDATEYAYEHEMEDLLEAWGRT